MFILDLYHYLTNLNDIMTCFTKRCCRYLFGCNFTNLYKSKCGLSYLNGVLGDNTIRSSYHRFAFDGIFLTSRRNQCSRVLGNACKPSTTTSSRIEVAYPNNSGILVSPNSAYVSYHFNTVTSRQAHTGQEHGDGRRRSQRQSRETTDTDKLRYSSTKVLKPNANNQARISKRTKKQIENVLDFVCAFLVHSSFITCDVKDPIFWLLAFLPLAYHYFPA